MKMKNVLITGSSSGIGFETALKFARNGCKVIATMRDTQSPGADKLREFAQNENLHIKIYKLDVTRQGDVDSVVEIINREYELRVDILVNNAGFGFIGPMETFSIDEIRQQYEVNVYGVVRVCKAIIPFMRANRAGKIINISSINGRISFPLYGVYSSSKFALETISEAMRFELFQWGIDVCLVEPGSFLTQFIKNRRRPKEFENSSEYSNVRNGFLAQYESAPARVKQKPIVSRLLSSTRVAHRIYVLSQKKRMPVRSVIGFDAHMYLVIKAIVPRQLWEWGVRRVFGL